MTVVSNATGPTSPIAVVSARLAKRERYDIVHTHGNWRAGLRELGPSGRRVHTYHGTSIGRMLACHEVVKSMYRTVRYRKSALTVAWDERRLGREADTCICVSASTLREARRFFRLASTKLTTIPSAYFPHGGDGLSRDEIRGQLGVPREAVVLLFVGRDNDPVKGATAFLQGVQPLLREGVEAIMAPGLTVRSEDGVRATGVLSHTDLERYYRAADIYVAPSLYEGGHSLSLLEAMSFGCVPVVSDTPALMEVVRHCSNGLVFTRGVIEQLTKHLVELIEDPRLRQRIGSEAKRSVQDWTWDDVARQTLALYERVLVGAGNTSGTGR